jgi:hypothetical protein
MAADGAATRGIARHLQGRKSDVLRLQEPRRRLKTIKDNKIEMVDLRF